MQLHINYLNIILFLFIYLISHIQIIGLISLLVLRDNFLVNLRRLHAALGIGTGVGYILGKHLISWTNSLVPVPNTFYRI